MWMIHKRQTRYKRILTCLFVNPSIAYDLTAACRPHKGPHAARRSQSVQTTGHARSPFKDLTVLPKMNIAGCFLTKMTKI